MKQYIVDAFTDKLFSGNPAEICVMDKWISDDLMLKIARENNFSETAFAVKTVDNYHLRWFTTNGEIDLCGHATLGCAFVIMNFYEPMKNEITFSTLSGNLIVIKNNDLYQMNFPVYDLRQVEVTEAMEKAIGVKPLEAYMGRDLMLILDENVNIRDVQPDMEIVKQLAGEMLHITKKSTDYDCESRSFAPKYDIIEDPVCGSGHGHIVPYWINKLNKIDLKCLQASERGGILYCKQIGNRIHISGNVVLFSVADLYI